jgi:VWFA-related protein
MKSFAAICLILLSFLVVLGQSGRKISPTPTPVPKISEDSQSYSESKPTERRAKTVLPKTSNEKTTQTQTSDATEETDEDAIKFETNLVTIPVSVFDRNGLYIPNLTQENFKVFEDGAEQEIAYFATTENPFTVVLLLDTSPSTAYKIEQIQDAAIAFVDQLKPQDKVIVIEFARNVNVLTEATNDRQKIYKAIRKADWGDGTSIYDAVDYTLRKKLAAVEGRKAIVLFTDGVDTTSTKSNYDKSLNRAEEADAVIFPIYYNTFGANRGNIWINPRGTSRSDYLLGKRYIDDLADGTGGRVFNAESSPRGLTGTFESIAEELRRQYSIGYYPKETGQAGQRKQIKVRVNRPNLVIRARDSYIVGAQQTTQTQK